MLQIGAMCERVAMYKPKLIKQLMCHNCETKASAVLDDDHWKRVVSNLHMSEQQRNELLKARQRFLVAIGDVLADRMVIQVRPAAHNGSFLT